MKTEIPSRSGNICGKRNKIDILDPRPFTGNGKDKLQVSFQWQGRWGGMDRTTGISMIGQDQMS